MEGKRPLSSPDLPQSLLDAFVAYGSSRPDIDALILFGSVARGEATERSDIDVAVLLTHEAARDDFDFLQVRFDIINILDREDTDVVFLNWAPPLLQHRVARDGHVLYARSNRAVAEFHLRAVQQYEDTRPLRKLLEDQLRASANEYLQKRGP